MATHAAGGTQLPGRTPIHPHGECPAECAVSPFGRRRRYPGRLGRRITRVDVRLEAAADPADGPLARASLAAGWRFRRSGDWGKPGHLRPARGRRAVYQIHGVLV